MKYPNIVIKGNPNQNESYRNHFSKPIVWKSFIEWTWRMKAYFQLPVDLTLSDYQASLLFDYLSTI